MMIYVHYICNEANTKTLEEVEILMRMIDCSRSQGRPPENGAMVQCGCTFPETVRLAASSQDWRDKTNGVTGLNRPLGT